MDFPNSQVRDRSTSSNNTQGIQMVAFDSNKPEGSIHSDEIPVPVDGTEEPQYEIPVSRSNQLDPERRAKEFRARHIQMMALGAAIGTGLMFQSGKALYIGGPVSLWLGYLLMGTVMYAVLITLGEMISFLPIPGGFFSLATRFLSPAIGFACGWSYWFAYAVGFPAKLVACQNIMAFWLPNDKYNPSIWISVFLVIPVLFNMFNVRRYGEIEFWLTVIKLITIVGLIVLGILLPMNASPTTRLLGTDLDTLELVECPSSDVVSGNVTCVGTPGFGYWREGAFRPYLVANSAGRFLGFWACCCQAIFSYVGTELIGIAADETEQQRRTLPRSVRRVSFRLAVYYTGAVLVLGLNVSANDPILQYDLFTSSYASPFVLMVRRAGIPGLEHIINAVALIAALSVANANLYVTSRSLYALAKEGMAPKIFEKKNWWDVPVYALLVSAVPSVLAYMSVKVSSNNVFDFLSKLTVTCALIPWAVICATYLRFRIAVKKQRMQRAIPEEAMSQYQPFLAVYGLAWSSLLIIFQGYEVFSRHDDIWAHLASSWGFTIAPWIAIAGVCLLVFAWVVKRYKTNGEWSFEVPRAGRADLHNGVAPLVKEDQQSGKKWRRVLMRILNAI